MNLLAHVLIAYATLPNTDGQECTGSIMADYYSGQDIAVFPPGLQAGLRQHRAVDAFTDAHPAFVAVRRAIAAAGAPRFTAGIITDIFWDHVLASEWDDWGLPLSGLGLEPFCAVVHGRIAGTEEYFGPGFAELFRAMVKDSWLSSYARLDAIERTLAGLSRRMSGQPDLASCASLLIHQGDIIRAGFATFWPELVDYARAWKQ